MSEIAQAMKVAALGIAMAVLMVLAVLAWAVAELGQENLIANPLLRKALWTFANLAWSLEASFSIFEMVSKTAPQRSFLISLAIAVVFAGFRTIQRSKAEHRAALKV